MEKVDDDYVKRYSEFLVFAGNRKNLVLGSVTEFALPEIIGENPVARA